MCCMGILGQEGLSDCLHHSLTCKDLLISEMNSSEEAATTR